MFDPGVSDIAACLYVIVAELASGEGCNARTATLARYAGVCRQTAQEALGELGEYLTRDPDSERLRTGPLPINRWHLIGRHQVSEMLCDERLGRHRARAVRLLLALRHWRDVGRLDDDDSPGYAEMAAVMRREDGAPVSTATARRMLELLEEVGYISSRPRSGKPKHYTVYDAPVIHTPCTEATDLPASSGETPCNEATGTACNEAQETPGTEATQKGQWMTRGNEMDSEDARPPLRVVHGTGSDSAPPTRFKRSWGDSPAALRAAARRGAAYARELCGWEQPAPVAEAAEDAPARE
ncbi:hypothetical protein [Bailinhaonella thermotolerans]|uniref:Uncharacterized protein n=1 Tax=Bailinhaonella thermotolerans TaxID=1070861 RepID=A0A3A4A2I3_9ACTN|nr:hypothetical protein [Bailinhaonella thermotolerans]RJL19242.1 hypothetical protein D5H75_40565 [Bailinhaonella thermotolerans]